MRRRQSASAGAVLRQAAIDDVVFFVDGNLAVVRNLVRDRDKSQIAGLALLDVDAGNARGLDGGRADRQRGGETETPTRPHATRQRHRRQESAALRMAVVADFRLAARRPEINPVPQRRQSVADGRRLRMIQRGRQRRDECRVDGVDAGLGLADPLTQQRQINVMRCAVCRWIHVCVSTLNQEWAESERHGSSKQSVFSEGGHRLR